MGCGSSRSVAGAGKALTGKGRARGSTSRASLPSALAFAAPLSARAATYYVAPNGSDAAGVPGTLAAPFGSWARAQTAANPGDTVYFRGGLYRYTDATSTCTSATATVNAVVLSKSGTSGSPIRYWAYPGETPVFDFSGISDPTRYSCRQVGVRVDASWLHLEGLELKGTLQLNSQNHESWCVYVTGGSNNVFERLDAHHNMGPGFFIQAGGHNTFLNCDSHENEDTLTSNGDGQSADGFGCHPDRVGDTGNVFHGCRAWWNSDDGWDFINSEEACTVEYSWAWYNGYKPDALSGGQPVALAAGNGNGFKGGGYGDPQTGVPQTPPQHTIRFDCAFYNKANGLYANHGIVSPYVYDNTSFNNGTDVDMLGLDGMTVTSVGILRNNLAYSNNGHGLLADMTHGGPISDEYNSWDTNLGLKVTDAGLPERRVRAAGFLSRGLRSGRNALLRADGRDLLRGHGRRARRRRQLARGRVSTPRLDERAHRSGHEHRPAFRGQRAGPRLLRDGPRVRPVRWGSVERRQRERRGHRRERCGSTEWRGGDDATVASSGAAVRPALGRWGLERAGELDDRRRAGDAASSGEGGCSCRVTCDEHSRGETGVGSLLALGSMLALRRRSNRA